MVDDVVHLYAVIRNGGEGAVAGAVDVFGLGKDGLGGLLPAGGIQDIAPREGEKPQAVVVELAVIGRVDDVDKTVSVQDGGALVDTAHAGLKGELGDGQHRDGSFDRAGIGHLGDIYMGTV